MTRILVASEDGLHSFGEDGAAGRTEFESRRVTELAPASSEAWAIVDRTELWRERDGAWGQVADLGSYSPTCITNI